MKKKVWNWAREGNGCNLGGVTGSSGDVYNKIYCTHRLKPEQKEGRRRRPSPTEGQGHIWVGHYHCPLYSAYIFTFLMCDLFQPYSQRPQEVRMDTT